MFFSLLYPFIRSKKVKCICCGGTTKLVTEALKVCADCIRDRFKEILPTIKEIQAKTRLEFGLPLEPPKDPQGIKCTICVNECIIPEGGKGYCGLRLNEKGRLIHLGGTAELGILDWYHDSLPTNCVADWVCPGGRGVGYPDYAYRNGPEYGYKNLAVFYRACSFNCLFCQNWHFRERANKTKVMSAEELASKVDAKTSCICYFGGDPAPQVYHSLKTSEIALKKAKGRILRICWETNGTMNQEALERMAELALNSGGCIKFDLKAYSEELNIALCGTTNRRTLENFRFLAEYIPKRRSPPFLVASTLLVPGYVDVYEVVSLAKFIASLNPEIPYSLLAFYPHFYFHDLPTTSRRHAEECQEAALKTGLKNVRIGNIHLLSDLY